MLQKHELFNGALLSANETSAHETSIQFSELHSNELRFNKNGKRRRRPADSRPLRQLLIDQLQLQFPLIRTASIKDTGNTFKARIKTHNGHTVVRSAYTLAGLGCLLVDRLSLLPV